MANLDAGYIQNFRLFRTPLCQLLLNVSTIVYNYNLLLLRYPALFIKSMTYSLVMHFFSYSLVYLSIWAT